MSQTPPRPTVPFWDRIRFQLARRSGNEAALAAFATPFDALADEVRGKSVALVGNARALAETTQGAQIDATDIVVRLNTAPGRTDASHGTRTDWIFTSVRLPGDVLRDLDPKHVFWASSKRKRLDYALARRPGFVLTPVALSQDLMVKLGSRPSTGMIATAALCALPFSQIRLHGFDFFSSLSLSGRRAAKDVPHDFGAERDLILQMAEDDPRLTVIKPRD